MLGRWGGREKQKTAGEKSRPNMRGIDSKRSHKQESIGTEQGC